ncbi:MAG TPA: hypothetical protein VL131_06690 [Gammaproteobacteria bacterium]|nr:hypothetical protein [Gammaproteobacteria bacterium]
MRLGGLQALLAELYALDLEYEVDDFLTTDTDLARALDASGREIDEKLLIAETDGEAEVSLYVEPRVLERLARSDPLAKLDGDNLEDFWTAFEGVSHFTYYAWNAKLEKSVTLLEMELQAEVDKYVATTLLLARQGQRPPRGLHHWLFEMPRLDERLDGDELERYRRANRYAGKYCRKLGPAIATGAAGAAARAELRRFYRLSQPSKIAHIEAD